MIVKELIEYMLYFLVNAALYIIEFILSLVSACIFRTVQITPAFQYYTRHCPPSSVDMIPLCAKSNYQHCDLNGKTYNRPLQCLIAAVVLYDLLICH
jgi:hypothetical protein